MQRVKDKIKHMCFVHEKIGKLSVPLCALGILFHHFGVWKTR